MVESSKLKILCSDDVVVEIEVNLASQMGLLQGYCEEPITESEIPLKKLKSPILEKVMDFCRHVLDHEPPQIEKPLRSPDFSSLVDPWYAQYITVESEILFELIMAANYLDIQPLLELASAKVASLIKDKSIKEIRQFFNIENDFTPEEEALII